jgi:hypothetical protein
MDNAIEESAVFPKPIKLKFMVLLRVYIALPRVTRLGVNVFLSLGHFEKYINSPN